MTSVPPPSSTAAVLGNPLLLDKILNFALFNDNPSYPIRLSDIKAAKSTACHLRLVQRSWLHSVLDCFYARILTWKEEGQQNPVALVDLNLSLDASTKVEHFTTLMTSANRVDSRILPFQLCLQPRFFTSKNRRYLQDLLDICGEGLVDLCLEFNEDICLLPPVFHGLHLPNLKTMTAYWFHPILGTPPPPEEHAEPEPSFELCAQLQVIFTQAMLNAAPNVASAVLECEVSDDSEFAPEALGVLRVPSTVTYLHFFLPPHTPRVDILQEWALTNRNGLENLQILHLYCCRYPYHPPEAGLMFRILDRCRRTLEELKVSGYRPTQEAMEGGGKKRCQLPVMERLASIEVNTCLGLLDNWISPRRRCLPNLKSFRISTETPSDLDKWTVHWPDSVKKVSLEIHADCDILNPSPKQLERIHLASSHITHLEIFINGLADMDGLRYIFRQMVSLRRLEVIVKVPCREEGIPLPPPLDWNALFIGCTPEMTKRLLQEYRKFGTVEQFVEREDTPSIRNLKNLHTLLVKWQYPNHPPDLATRSPNQDHFTSDISFLLSFFKMYSLKELILQAERSVTQKIVQEWRVLKGREVIL